METGAVLYELGRADQGLALFMFLQNCVGMAVFEACCNEEQKKRFLPDLISFNKFSAFGLTEPLNGSDATGM